VRFNPLTAGLGDADPNAVFQDQPFAFAPELTVTAAATYVQPIGDNLQALFYLDTRWNDGYRTQTLSRAPNGATDNDAFAIFNGRVGIGSQDERWSVEFWGRNLTDEYYFVGAFSPPLQNDYVVYPNEPATYGVTIRARY
jgi:outer membrane receptor protein involved in Fe transport